MERSARRELAKAPRFYAAGGSEPIPRGRHRLAVAPDREAVHVFVCVIAPVDCDGSLAFVDEPRLDGDAAAGLDLARPDPHHVAELRNVLARAGRVAVQPRQGRPGQGRGPVALVGLGDPRQRRPALRACHGFQRPYPTHHLPRPLRRQQRLAARIQQLPDARACLGG